MKALLTLAALALSLPALTDWLVDRQFPEPAYSKEDVRAMDSLVDGVLFQIKQRTPVTEFHRSQARALAKIYDLTDEDVTKPVVLW